MKRRSEHLASIQLNNGGTPYSERERSVFKLLPKDGKRISTKTLAQKFFKKNSDDLHQNANVVIIGVMRSLRWKMEKNNEPLRIMKSARAGPHPLEFWLEKKT
jgi:hypothetical protein